MCKHALLMMLKKEKRISVNKSKHTIKKEFSPLNFKVNISFCFISDFVILCIFGCIFECFKLLDLITKYQTQTPMQERSSCSCSGSILQWQQKFCKVLGMLFVYIKLLCGLYLANAFHFKSKSSKLCKTSNFFSEDYNHM